MTIRFNIEVDPARTFEPFNGFQGVSRDPVNMIVIPEPITMLGACLGLIGVGGYIRKRRLT